MPYKRLSNANIITVIGRPKEMTTPKPNSRQNANPITSHAISLQINANHNVISSHFILLCKSRFTTAWMQEVEQRRDAHMDVSGRVVSGTKTEQLPKT